MIDKENMKIVIKKLKEMIKKIDVTDLDDLNSLHMALGLIYERVSNRKDKDYTKQYSASRILTSKTMKEIVRHKKGTGAVFEIVEYDTAPNGFVIIYNGFENGKQTTIDFYVIKN